MDKDYVKGLKQGLGILTVLFVTFTVYAVGFHQTTELMPGTFQGDYNFNGSIGIGTTTPESKLDVDGYVKIGTDEAMNGRDYTLGLNKYSAIWAYDENEYRLTHNAYYDNGWKYRENTTGAGATSINIGGGRFRVKTASTGATNSTISWSQGLYQDDSGNIGIGTTDPVGPIHVKSRNNFYTSRSNYEKVDDEKSEIKPTGIVFTDPNTGYKYELVYQYTAYQDSYLAVGDVLTRDWGGDHNPIGLMRIE